ncbi:uncharacterized protein [Rutidosis leptorrhynchoides]|uniref:uncharacterized protein n=1 Tax=Rutidosis leptorrhynchoides TaxID=125765 RepID=UPI003A9A064E
MMRSIYSTSACRSSYFYDPGYFLDARCEINPLSISTSFVTNCCCCCCCCTNNSNNYLVYNRLPRINPSFVCNGLRQSTLIQFSPSKRLVYHGRRRQTCSSDSVIRDSDRNYYYEKLYSFKEGRKFGKGRFACLGNNDKTDIRFVRDDETDDEFVDEVDLLLDLLTEEIGVKERKKVEKKKDDGYVKGKMKSVRLGSVKKDSKCGNKGVEIRSNEEEDRRRLRKERREEEKRSSMQGVNRELRKEGSSCSSYYSVSSTGEYENGNDDVEIRGDDGYVRGESSSEYKDDRVMDAKSYDERVDQRVDLRRKEENENVKKNSVDLYYGNEEWRKKSEKKLNVESSQQQSQVSWSNERNSQQDIVKTDKITGQSQSMKFKRLVEKSELDNRVIESSTNKRHGDGEYKLVTDRRESADRVQSNLNLEASRIHKTDKKGTSKFNNKVTESSTSTRDSDTEHKLITGRRERSDLVTRQNQNRKQSNVNLEASRIHGIDEKETLELDNKVTESSTDKRYSDTEYKVITDRRESADRITRRNEYTKQSNVNIEASRIHDIDKNEASTSSSSLEARMKNWEDYTTEVSDQVEDRREGNQQSIDHLTTFEQPRFEYQQISETSDNRMTSTESNRRNETKELRLGTSSSTEKVTVDQQVDLRRKGVEDTYMSSGVELEEGPTKSVTTGRKTTKALSFTAGMPKAAASTYKAMKLNPEPNLQQTGAGEIIHEDAIVSAEKQHKSSRHYMGEFIEKAKHELSISEVQQENETGEVGLVYEDDEVHELKSSGDDGSGNFDRKDGPSGPSDEMWHETGASSQQPAGTDAPDSTGNDDTAKKRGRSLWNVIGDVVRLRWASPPTETHTPKSGVVKASSNQSASSERWFSGHESSDDNVKIGSTKGRKESSKTSSTKDKSDSPILLSSSTNTNQGSSSKTVSPSMEESSFPLPAIRMRRSPIVKKTSDKTDASTSDKMGEVDLKPVTQVSQMDVSGSGKMVVVDQSVPTRRKLGRTGQVSKDVFDEWEEAYTVEAKQRQQDEFFMREALLEAKKAADFWEVPVGAVLVQDGKVIARGYNLVEELRDSTAHAEMICIREASNNLRSWRLSGTTLYVTLEPCPMCAGAILQARVDTLVWGAPNKLLGADGSWIRLFPDVDGGNGSDKPPAPVHPFHPNMAVRRGVLSAECADVMQQFFQLRRKKKEKKTETEPPTIPPPSCLPIPQHHNSKFLSKLHDTFGIMFCL